jgi:outer membrane protein assembly factor BamA
MLDAAADELRDHFRELGFRRVTVGWHRVPAGAGQVDAQFEIVRGTSVVIDAIDIHGNVHAPRAALNAVLKSVVTAGTPWRDDQVTDAKLRLLIWYVDHGYVKADADVAEPTGAHSKLVFTITEGNQYRLGKIDIVGVPDTDRERYLTLVGLHPGEVASRAAIMDAGRRLRDAAHPSNLWTNTTLDDAKHTFDVTFQLAGAGTTSDGEVR